MRFSVGDLRKGLALASCGIRIDEYDDTTARLEWQGKKLCITRSDDIASTRAELVGEPVVTQLLPDMPEQPRLPMDMLQALANPVPQLDPMASPAATPSTHVDALLLSKILSVTPPDEDIAITQQDNAQQIETESGNYYTLIPPPSSKLRAPQTLPFDTASLYEVGDAVKATAAFSGDPKKLLDCLILTVHGGKVWIGRSMADDCVAAYELVGDTPPMRDGVNRALFRPEMERLLSRLDEFTPWHLSLDLLGNWAHHEIEIDGWEITSTTPLHRVLEHSPGDITQWMTASPEFEFTVPVEMTVQACQAAKMLAVYTPPTAATRDTSDIAVPYEGAADEKPKAKKYVTLGFSENRSSLIMSGHGWRYDRTAAEIPFLKAPDHGGIESWFRQGATETTVSADLLWAAVSAANPEDDSYIHFSICRNDNTDTVIVRTRNGWFVMPTHPEWNSE